VGQALNERAQVFTWVIGSAISVGELRVEAIGARLALELGHVIFKTPWPGNPRVNIQNDKGRAKAYQVKQVLLAIERLGAKP
jgi:hypothetical protein